MNKRVALNGLNLSQSNLERRKTRTIPSRVAHFPGKFKTLAFPKRTQGRFKLSREECTRSVDNFRPSQATSVLPGRGASVIF